MVWDAEHVTRLMQEVEALSPIVPSISEQKLEEGREVQSLILSGVKDTSVFSGFQSAPTACKVRTVFCQRTWQKHLHTLYFSMVLLKLQ